ncbi:MAG: glyoxalase, partial [Woeseia sp.]|nr:glyoxalase [Woeseia sp.]
MYRPSPIKLGHIVLWVRDIHASAKFYEEIVGLTVSDWISDRMVFMRAGEDHHDMALAQLPENAPE